MERVELAMKERQSLEESMMYWRNQTKDLERRLEEKGASRSRDEEHKEITFNYTTVSQPVQLSSYDSAAERASYLPIAWDGVNRTVETQVEACPPLQTYEEDTEEEVEQNLGRLLEGGEEGDVGPWVEEILGEKRLEDIKKYLMRLVELVSHMRKEREEMAQEMDNAKGVLE